ncbi:MAG: hypothetical protein ACRDGH_07040, partial [Candidatus Limnocylindria bacterium]
MFPKLALGLGAARVKRERWSRHQRWARHQRVLVRPRWERLRRRRIRETLPAAARSWGTRWR